MTIQKNIAAKIRCAMMEENCSLEEFAQELGIARSSLREYLRENANPRVDTVELLAEKLGCTPAELISDKSTGELQDLRTLPSLHPVLQPFADGIRREILRLSDEIYRIEQEK